MSKVSSMRLSNASAAFTLSSAIKSQIEVRSISARGLLRALFAMLCGQPLSSLCLDTCEHVANFFSRPAVKTLLNFGTQRFQLGLAAFFALFDQAQPVPHHFASPTLAPALYQPFHDT